MTKPKSTTTTKTKIEIQGRAAQQGARSGSQTKVPLVVSTGCPRGIGPEVSVVAAQQMLQEQPERGIVLVGDRAVLANAAKIRGINAQFIEQAESFFPSQSKSAKFQGLRIQHPGPQLSTSRAHWGKPQAVDGLAQLLYVEEGYRLSVAHGFPLVTGPVSKEVIAGCGERRAKKFRGHTEWLQALDEAPYSVMCFQSERLTSSLVTTHVPVRALSRLLSPELVYRSIVEIYDLLARLGMKRPRIAVCSLNPHAGEGELLGTEERTAIVPGVLQAKKKLGKSAVISGPVGAETAFRKAAAGGIYDGVVAMYHDQATIPMKLLDFGGAVNVTQGLSVIRTSVDHGTAYDIAGRAIAAADGMMQAMRLAGRLAGSKRRL